MSSSPSGKETSKENGDRDDDNGIPEMGDLFTNLYPYNVFMCTYRAQCGNTGETILAVATEEGQEGDHRYLTVSL